MAADRGNDRDLQQITDAFIVLRKRARKLGIKDAQLSRLKAVKNLRVKRHSWFVATSALFGLLAVIAGCGAFLYQQGILSHHTLYRYVERVIDFDMESDVCLIPYPEIILDLFRPPVDCNVCKDVHEVEKVAALTKEEFLRNYAYTSRPVVITDGTQGWTAPYYFSFSYFKSIYGPNSPVLLSEDQKCQFFPYKTNFASLQEVFNMSEKDANMEGKHWYIGW